MIGPYQFQYLLRTFSELFPNSEARREPWFHRKSKSHIYNLIRRSILLEREYGSCIDMDSVFVRWDYDTPWEVLLEKGARAFRNLYKINYELWRKRRKSP